MSLAQGGEVTAMRNRAEQLRQAAAKLDAAASALEFADAPADAELLGGGKLIAAVARVVKPGEVVHYRDIVHRLAEIAVVPRGKAPANTLLGALHRSPHYSPTVARSGEYRRRGL